MNRAFGCPARPEEHGAAPLAGGIVRNGYQCGMVWGAALAAGAEAYRCFGVGPRAETAALVVARRIVESFRAQNGAVDCFDLTGTDFGSTAQTWKYLVSGKPVACFRMAARYAPVAFAEARAALGEDHAGAPPAPVSCSALVAKKLGASDLHEVMAAGFAGGVGLSGVLVWAAGRAFLAATGQHGQFTLEAADHHFRGVFLHTGLVRPFPRLRNNFFEGG